VASAGKERPQTGLESFFAEGKGRIPTQEKKRAEFLDVKKEKRKGRS